MDYSFAKDNSIPFVTRSRPLSITTLNGQPLGDGLVKYDTTKLTLQVGALHKEEIVMSLIDSPLQPVILGYPWLQQHNPSFDWINGELTSWGTACFQSCLSLPRRLPGCLLASVAIPPTLPPEYHDFADVFCKKRAEVLPPHRPYDCAINLIPGAPLPKGKTYPLSLPEQKSMGEYVKDSLERGFIRPSSSPVGAGFFFVEKKDGGLRPCIDYRGLNQITVKDSYPLPLILELFDVLKGAVVFTKLDLRGAYNLVRIREGDEWKTAFNTRNGHFEYLVMPFGLCNAPAVFQRFMNDAFCDLNNRFVIVYLDDILVFSKTHLEHVSHVKQVLQRLRENRLYAKIEKCSFHQDHIPFLGYIISSDGFQMDPQKLSAVLEWPQPTTLRGLQSFLGFANYYRRFIKGFASIAAPLTAMTKKGTNCRIWSSEAVSSFQKLKDMFSKAPVLQHPNPDLQYIVEVDASEVGAGAVLSQRQPTSGRIHPVAFFSRKFSPTEKNYDVGNRELLAIKLALSEWRHLLEGALKPFSILTDHKNLLYIQTAKRLNSRQARWALFFSRFNFVLSYVPGHKNKKADALSRQFNTSEEDRPTEQYIIPPHKIVAQISTALSQQLQETQNRVPQGMKVPTGRLFVVPSLRRPVLLWAHDGVLSGHPGITITLKTLQRHVWWPNMRKDVTDYVAACPTCAVNKVPRTLPTGLLQPIPAPRQPWTHLTMDFISDLPKSAGMTAIWVIVDRFSKMTHFVPLPGLPTAEALSALFISHVVRHHGIPSNIISDRGAQFISRFWRAFCKKIGVTLSLSTSHHPQTDGQTERMNQTLETYLRHYINALHSNWSEHLPMAEFAINSRWHSALHTTPFYAALGYHPQTFPLLQPSTGVPAADQRVNNMLKHWKRIRLLLRKAAGKYSFHANKRRRYTPPYTVGDRVWLSTRYVRLKQPSTKLGPRFIGPYKVLARVGPVSYRLRLPSSLRIHPVFHVSLLKKAIFNRYSRKPQLPPPVLVDGQREFEVSKILDSRRRGRGLQYLVHWKGYPIADRSWVPAKDLHAPALIRDFHASFPTKPC